MKSIAFRYLLITLSFFGISGTWVYGYIYSQTRFQTAIGRTIDYFSNSMIQTVDGGYAVAGFTNSCGAGPMISIL